MYNYPYFNDNMFTGYYISNYNDVLNMAVPSNGQSVLFANLDEGMIWSKKLVQGVPQIQPYKIIPVYDTAREPVKSNTDSILEQLKTITERLNKMEDKNESKQSNVQRPNGTIEK